MTVSLFGLAPDYDSIVAIAKKHHLVVIEDDAQCFLGKYRIELWVVWVTCQVLAFKLLSI